MTYEVLLTCEAQVVDGSLEFSVVAVKLVSD